MINETQGDAASASLATSKVAILRGHFTPGYILLVIIGIFTGIELGTMLTTYLNSNTLEGVPEESLPIIVGIATIICGSIGVVLGAYLARQTRARLLLPVALFIAIMSALIYLSYLLLSPHYEQSASFWYVTALALAFGVTCTTCGVGLIIEGIKEKKPLFVALALSFALFGSAALVLDFLVIQSDSNTEAAFRHYIVGGTNLQAENYAAAVNEFSAAIELSPYVASYYMQRAEAFTAEGDIDKAIADYIQITRIRPNYPYGSLDRAGADAGLGKLYTSQGNYVQAIISYRDDIKEITAIGEQVGGFNADFLLFDYYAGIGDAFSGNGNYDEAITSYSNAITMKDFALNTEEVYYGRGLAYKAKGEKDKAIADFQMIVSNSALGQKAKQQLQELGVAPD